MVGCGDAGKTLAGLVQVRNRPKLLPSSNLLGNHRRRHLSLRPVTPRPRALRVAFRLLSQACLSWTGRLISSRCYRPSSRGCRPKKNSFFFLFFSFFHFFRCCSSSVARHQIRWPGGRDLWHGWRLGGLWKRHYGRQGRQGKHQGGARK
jgi:hypothetical protein